MGLSDTVQPAAQVAYLLHLVVGIPGIPGPLFVFRPTTRYAKAVRLDGLGPSCLVLVQVI
jgi:hypothetical protein